MEEELLFNFWGTDNSNPYHKLVTGWVTGTPPQNYSGTIGIANSTGVNASNYTNLFSNNLNITVNTTNSTIIVGMNREDLIPNSAFGQPIVTAAAVGSSSSWNDDIYSSTGTMTLDCISFTTSELMVTHDMTNNTLISNANGVEYQWINCDDNFAIINGEINKEFTPTTNGNYAVEITANNNCKDTSECLSVSTLNIRKNTLFSNLSIFPNPSSGLVNIKMGDINDLSIKIINVDGKVVYEKQHINSLQYQFELNEERGIYFIEVSSKKAKEYYKLIKK